MTKWTIIKTTKEYIGEILSTEHDGKFGSEQEHYGLFYWEEGMKWLGCDNTSEDCFIEEFDYLGDCLTWLIGEDNE